MLRGMRDVRENSFDLFCRGIRNLRTQVSMLRANRPLRGTCCPAVLYPALERGHRIGVFRQLRCLAVLSSPNLLSQGALNGYSPICRDDAAIP